MSESAGEPIGLFQTWWRGDPLPNLPPVPGLAIAPTDDERLVASLSGLGAREVGQRLRQGHRPWLARIEGVPASYGWVAAGSAWIGELGVTLALTSRDRYLWNFVTLPPWRGRGIYPRLLHAMLVHEGEAERFWVGHNHANVASARGIAKAGFRPVGTLYRLPDGGFELVPSGPTHRAAAVAALVDVPLARPYATSTR